MFSVGVVAHSSRVDSAKDLARRVGALFISIDNGLLGCDQNHKVVLRHLSSLGGDWAVVLEDDAVPVAGFRDQLGAALTVTPNPVVSLYIGRKRPPQYQRHIAQALRKADDVGAHWLVGKRMLHGVGYAVRSDLLPSLLEFESDLPVDEHISAWAADIGVSYCVPSLVDHADDPTLVQHRDGQRRRPGRVAWRVGSRAGWESSSVPLAC